MRLSGNEVTRNRVSASTRRTRAVLRVAKLIAAGAVVVVFAACTDTTSPAAAAEASAPVVPQGTNPVATELGNWVVDATFWVTPSLVDETNRGKLEGSINGLAGHLMANNTTQIVSDIATIRSLINSGSFTEYVELGPIELAMATIENTLGLNG